jgi:uncharacterized protein
MAAMHSTKKADDAGFSKEDLQVLLRVAKEAIRRKLDGNARLGSGDIADFAGKSAGALSRKRGAFVTLTLGKNLRGCIGSLSAQQPLLEAVYSNALNAAFSDTRFLPLTRREFEKSEIEVSVLSPLVPLEYSGGRDLLSKLVPNKHGVLLEFSNGSGATFLPQVWEQIPDAEDFLSHLCAKAGMPAAAWRDFSPKVLTYTVQSAQRKASEIR